MATVQHMYFKPTVSAQFSVAAVQHMRFKSAVSAPLYAARNTAHTLRCIHFSFHLN